MYGPFCRFLFMFCQLIEISPEVLKNIIKRIRLCENTAIFASKKILNNKMKCIFNLIIKILGLHKMFLCV